jgi:hypothetical protein
MSIQLKGNDNSSFSDSATFEGDVQVAGDPSNGSAEGSKVDSSGGFRAARTSGTQANFRGYSVGTAGPTSQILANGSATFAGLVEAKGSIEIDRTNENYLTYKGAFNGTTTSYIKADGTATFVAGLSYNVGIGSTGTFSVGDVGVSGQPEAGTNYTRLGITVYKNNQYNGSSTSLDNNLILGYASPDANQARSLMFAVNNSGRVRSAGGTAINPISSERRLKTNIELIDPNVSWQTIRDLPFYSYNWKSNPDCLEKTYGPMVDEVPSEMSLTTYEENEAGEEVVRMDAEGPIRTYDNDMLQGRL